MATVGLLWEFSGKDIEGEILSGLSHFRKEYGCEPEQIELNPFHIQETFKGRKNLEGVSIVEGKQVFKNQAVYGLGDSIEDLLEKRKKRRLKNEGWLAE